MSADEIYEVNPTLIPALVAQSREQADDPEAGQREKKAWLRCGWEHGDRTGMEHQGAVFITLAYTLRVSNEKAVLVDLERTEGGDDELVRCLGDARTWMKEPFPAHGAKDGIFRWEGPAVAVPLGNNSLGQRPPEEKAAAGG